ncbi:hypothetical protein BDF19DRAFT_437836 [Syncephalis fuscata]|nr:hypothetical protein BDF19DRAFT_437836 [Syncephalis fuscata]
MQYNITNYFFKHFKNHKRSKFIMPSSNNDEINIAWSDVGISASFIVVNIIVSLCFRLGLERSLIVSSIRCTGQLAVMGLVLRHVLTSEEVGWILSLAVLLTVLGAWETVYHQCKIRHRGMFWTVLLATAGSTIIIGLLGCAFVLHFKPVWTARLFIPTIGMLLGNSISGIALGLRTCLNEVHAHRDHIEQQLSFGATRWEASRNILRSSVRMGMLPTVNSMSVMGIISIPGVMSGQILGGVPVDQAVRYQICIMFMIAASTTLGIVTAALACVHTCVDHRHRTRPERIITTPIIIYAWRNAALKWAGIQIMKLIQPSTQWIKKQFKNITCLKGQSNKHSHRRNNAPTLAELEKATIQAKDTTKDTAPEMSQVTKSNTNELTDIVVEPQTASDSHHSIVEVAVAPAEQATSVLCSSPK